MSLDYSPPVAALLMDAEPDYQAIGLTEQHIPELIELATDREILMDWDRQAACVAAWKALAYLHAEDAVTPLIGIFPLIDDGMHIIMNELPAAFGGIGAAAVDPLYAYMTETTNTETARIVAVMGLIAVAEANPDQQVTVADLFNTTFADYATYSNEFNGYLVMGLVKTGATDAAKTIEQAFEAKQVDPFIIGDWDKVQVEMGLTTYEELRKKDRPDGSRPPSLREVIAEGLEEATADKRNATKRKVDKSRKKSKRKQAAKSRKKNRKK